jgi:hypothetical protein
MTRAPDGFRLPRRHIAHFLDTVAWAGATIHDEGGGWWCAATAAGCCKREVTRREGAIRRGGR